MKERGRSADADRPRDVFRLGREGAYHFVGIVLVVWLIVAIALALLQTSPEQVIEDFGSVAAGRVFQAGIVLTGILPLALWLWWIHRYVRRLTWDARAGEVEVELFRHFGTEALRFRPSDLVTPSFHRGTVDYRIGPSVDAPYLKVYLAGRSSLIVDLRGDVIDSEALMTILAGNAPEA